MNTHTDNGTHGSVLVGADFDGHDGYVRGIFEQDGIFTALGGTFSKDFKTLKGATAYMARKGYDAFGRRI